MSSVKKMGKTRIPTEAERLAKYFYKLKHLIPEPPSNWRLNAKECKWLKIIKERNNNPNGPG